MDGAEPAFGRGRREALAPLVRPLADDPLGAKGETAPDPLSGPGSAAPAAP